MLDEYGVHTNNERVVEKEDNKKEKEENKEE